MERTIEGAIHEIEKELSSQRYDCGIAQLSTGLRDAMKTAVDTMQKYQTMQGVLEKVWNASSCMLDKTPTFNFECLNEIMETYRTVR